VAGGEENGPQVPHLRIDRDHRVKLGEKVRNPIGHGWVEITETGHCSTEFSNRSFTPEGELIPGDTVATYWALPGDRG
jgi:hypothetical protein